MSHWQLAGMQVGWHLLTPPFSYPRAHTGTAAAAAIPGAAGGGAEPDEFGEDDRGEAIEGESSPASPVGRLRARRPYWLATMHQIGMVCATTLSVITSGYRLEWDPAKGPPPRCHLRNHPSANANAAFVSEKVAEGMAWRSSGEPCSAAAPATSIAFYHKG